jgi:hypothetical protein
MNTSTRHSEIRRTPALWPPLTQAERDHLRARAVAEAPVLRGQAIAAFWHDADAVLGDAVDSARRAAIRLAARFRQHCKLRATDGAVGGEY